MVRGSPERKVSRSKMMFHIKLSRIDGVLPLKGGGWVLEDLVWGCPIQRVGLG